MKHFAIYLHSLAVLLLSCLAAHSSISAQSLQSIAVLDLEARGISVVETASLTDRLRSEMVKTGRITVVERGQMQQILQEQDFQLTGCTTEECAVEIGQLLGVSKMLAGSIGKVGSTFSIDLRTIDVTTGRITNSITRDYRGEIDGLLAQMTVLAREIVDFEAPETATSQAPELAISPEQGPEKRSSLLKWAAIGATDAGRGYRGITLMAGEEADSPTVGTPPNLPEGP